MEGEKFMAIEKINQNICIGCGRCAKICPMDVIRMDAQTEKAMIKYYADCMICEFCTLDCPVGAIIVTTEKYSPVMLSCG
jgi:formate hydrogenlyase subunit 6/NADH:ubiquinone oxidoreductase subunit I